MEPPAEDASGMDEEGHYFDFITFYKRVEFSDRAIRLEILEESRQDLEPKNGEASSSSTTGGPPPEVEEVPVNSIVIAAKSRVLRTMLSSGMRESDKSAPVVLKVTPEEKEAFKELLHFLYAGSLSPRFSETSTDIHELINLLLVGDKYEVPSFMGAVINCIHGRERSIPDSATLVQGLLKILDQAPKVRRLAEEARAHIISKFKDVSTMWDSPEFLSLRREAVEILLQSEDLEADSEEEILGKVLVWLKARYSELQERDEVFAEFAPSIRFTCIRGEQLAWLLTFVKVESTRNLIMAALRFRASSDEEKRKVTGATFERRGIQAVHMEIVGQFPLDEGDTSVASYAVPWCGKLWYADVKNCKDSDPPTLGVSLCCKNVDGSKGAGVIVHFEVFAKTWPDGLWKHLFKASAEFDPGSDEDADFGETALSMSWDEARKSDVYTGGTGLLTLKVVACRLSTAKPTP